jgi:transposase-like protein
VAQAMGDAEEIKQLRRKISDLEKTNYILKKAAAFFSQDHLK